MTTMIASTGIGGIKTAANPIAKKNGTNDGILANSAGREKQKMEFRPIHQKRVEKRIKSSHIATMAQT